MALKKKRCLCADAECGNFGLTIFGAASSTPPPYDFTRKLHVSKMLHGPGCFSALGGFLNASRFCSFLLFLLLILQVM